MNQLNELEILNKIKSFFKKDESDDDINQIKSEIKRKKGISDYIFQKILNKLTKLSKDNLKLITDGMSKTENYNRYEGCFNKIIKIKEINVHFKDENSFKKYSNNGKLKTLKTSIDLLKDCFINPLDKLHIYLYDYNVLHRTSTFTIITPDEDLIFNKYLISEEYSNDFKYLKDLYYNNKYFNIFCETLFRYKSENITFSKSKHKVNYTMNQNVYIFINDKDVTTEYDLTATLLHELGHNVFRKMLAIRYASVNLISIFKYKYDDIKNVLLFDKKAMKEKGKLYLLKIIFGIILYFLYFIYYLGYQGSEKAADKFCLMCGYNREHGHFIYKFNAPREDAYKKIYNKATSNLLKRIINKLTYLLSCIMPYDILKKNDNSDFQYSVHYVGLGDKLMSKPGVVKNMHDPKFYDELPSSMVSEQFILDLFGFFLNECIK